MTKKELYFSADVETDGPIPGSYSMLSFGVVALTQDGKELGAFEANLRTLPNAKQDPKTMEWWRTQPEAWDMCRKDLQEPLTAMQSFVNWVSDTCGKDYVPVMVCMPAGFDFMFLYWYMKEFANNSPFSFSCVDMRTFVMATRKTGYKKTSKRYWPKRWFPNLPHTHVAVEDAREQGLAFINMLKENRGVKIKETEEKKPKIKRDLSTKENREYWASVKAAAEEVNKWPAWKRGGVTFKTDYGENENE